MYLGRTDLISSVLFVVLIDQLRSRSSQKVDVRPILERIWLLNWKTNHAGGEELAETALHFGMRNALACIELGDPRSISNRDASSSSALRRAEAPVAPQ